MSVPPRSSIPVGRAALSGVLGAGAALAAGEMVSALDSDGPSLVAAVANRFIDRFAAPLKDIAVQLFGTNDKPALVIGIVVTSLLLGGGLGVIGRRRFTLAMVGFAVFGAIGAWAITSDARDSGAIGAAAALAAVVAGVVVLRTLLAVAASAPAEAAPEAPEARVAPEVPTAEPIVDPSRPGRRAFLIRSAAVGAGVLVAGGLSRSIGGGGAATAARRTTVIPKATSARSVPAGLDIAGISPYLTPNADFYRIDTAVQVPDIDPAGWELKFSGMVDRPFSITYAELLELATVAEPVTIQCVSNEVGGHLVGTAIWQGVPLADLLERAGVQPGATQIVGHSVDGWTAGFPTDLATDGRVALVAVAMNGEPLPVANGFPARLIVSGIYGYVSATKWLSEIELTTWEAVDGYWVPRGWAKEGPIKTTSRIDVPRSGTALTAGRQAIAGVAWAPDRGIEAVEVQVDDGDWMPCRLGEVASEHTWVQWVHEWDATPGEHTIRVRATDATGATQTADRAQPAPDGATGWHERTVRVTA